MKAMNTCPISRIIIGETVIRWAGGFGESRISRYESDSDRRSGWEGKSDAICPSEPTQKSPISICGTRVEYRSHGSVRLVSTLSICDSCIPPLSRSLVRNFTRSCHSLESVCPRGTIRSSRNTNRIFSLMAHSRSTKFSASTS